MPFRSLDLSVTVRGEVIPFEERSGTWGLLNLRFAEFAVDHGILRDVQVGGILGQVP